MGSTRISIDNTHLLWRLRHNETAKHLCELAASEIERLNKLIETAEAEGYRQGILAMRGVEDDV